MNDRRRFLAGWPKASKVLFIIFGFLFIAAVIFLVLSSRVSWQMAVAAFVVTALVWRLIVLTLQRETDTKSLALCFTYAVFGMLLVVYTFNLNQGMKNIYQVNLSLRESVLNLKEEVADLDVYANNLETIIENIDPALLPSNPPSVSSITPLNVEEGPSNTLILSLTAISGLVTALTSLYGQVIAARKLKLEFELLKRQTAQAQEKPAAKKRSSKPKKKESRKGL